MFHNRFIIFDTYNYFWHVFCIYIAYILYCLTFFLIYTSSPYVDYNLFEAGTLFYPFIYSQGGQLSTLFIVDVPSTRID